MANPAGATMPEIVHHVMTTGGAVSRNYRPFSHGLDIPDEQSYLAGVYPFHFPVYKLFPSLDSEYYQMHAFEIGEAMENLQERMANDQDG